MSSKNLHHQLRNVRYTDDPPNFHVGKAVTSRKTPNYHTTSTGPVIHRSA